MADVYLVTNSPYAASDVLLVTASATVATSAPGGEPREVDDRFQTQRGRLWWRVRFTGHLDPVAAGAVSVPLSATPTGFTGTLRPALTGTASVTTAGHVAVRCEMQPVAATHHIDLTPEARLIRISDPPELWELLDMVELT